MAKPLIQARTDSTSMWIASDNLAAKEFFADPDVTHVRVTYDDGSCVYFRRTPIMTERGDYG